MNKLNINDEKFFVKDQLIDVEGVGFEAKESSGDQHSKRIEINLVLILSGVIFLSFISLLIPYIGSLRVATDRAELESVEKASEKLSAFASSTGTTALGALVALLASKRKESS